MHQSSREDFLTRIRESAIGDGAMFETPFGERSLVYADYTASGRALSFIEDYVREQVLPFYANTHSESSMCGARTSRLYAWARQEIVTALNCRPSDRVIFCGAGTTAAVHKWIDLLGLKDPPAEGTAVPLVIIGTYEHHSNDLPWRELNVERFVVPLDQAGHLDQTVLEQTLMTHAGKRRIICSFSAASNVTGLLTDVEGITALCRRYGALCGWDYAAAAPYVRMDMQTGGGVDAIFFSPHKFVGGPDTPGVLAVDTASVTRLKPTQPGGGTVTFVSQERQTYAADLGVREEPGTPNIIGGIRAGLAMKVRQTVGTDYIEQRDAEITRRVFGRLANNSDITILGSQTAPRLPVFSMQFSSNGQPLHFGFVVSLLNDLFGIQCRGGCSCAGSYGHHLLDISEEASIELERKVVAEGLVHRPGWVRLSFHYASTDSTIDYVLDALEFIAANGSNYL
ncbi:MAG: aminotransferase class V-fold PLP-dependent enzyme, partial [Pseudomonadales bacterium]|nr:aminotransferase class V-fold PLP-dependent enzyme [Pseudomonadales bacterium]